MECECSDVDLKTVADALDKDWRTIAKLLGLDKNDISKIEDGGDENAFAGIVSHWRRRRNDTLTFDGLMTVLRESTEYRGRQDYLDNIMRPILGTHNNSTVCLFLQNSTSMYVYVLLAMKNMCCYIVTLLKMHYCGNLLFDVS